MKAILIWLPLLVVAIVLNSIRPTASEDPRWVPNERPYYAHGEAMFYAWVLPALGVVWTFAQLLRVPQGERVGSARMIVSSLHAGVGISVVLLAVMPYIADFNPPGVGTVVAMLAWLRLALFIAFVSVLIVMTRAVQPNATPRAVGLKSAMYGMTASNTTLMPTPACSQDTIIRAEPTRSPCGTRSSCANVHTTPRAGRTHAKNIASPCA